MSAKDNDPTVLLMSPNKAFSANATLTGSQLVQVDIFEADAPPGSDPLWEVLVDTDNANPQNQLVTVTGSVQVFMEGIAVPFSKTRVPHTNTESATFKADGYDATVVLEWTSFDLPPL